MKNLFLFLTIIILFTACSDENSSDINSSNEFETTSNSENILEDLELSINLKEYYDISFSNSNISAFLKKYSADLISGEGFYFKRDDKYTIVRISSPEYEQKMLALNTQNFNIARRVSGKKTCKTCRSEECVKKTIATAVGDGTSTVHIRVRLVKRLGVRTGVEVCYSPTPIEAQVSPLPTLTLEGLGIYPERENDENELINIDELLMSSGS